MSNSRSERGGRAPDRDAFAELSERHAGWMRGMVAGAYRRCADPVLHDYDDLHQIAALALWRAAAAYEPASGTPAETWLGMLVAQDLGKAVRRSWAKRRRPDRRARRSLPPARADRRADEPLEAALDAEAIAQLRAVAATALRVEERAALALVIQGHTWAEVALALAEVFGYSEQTGWRRVWRMRAALRDDLQAAGWDL